MDLDFHSTEKWIFLTCHKHKTSSSSHDKKIQRLKKANESHSATIPQSFRNLNLCRKEHFIVNLACKFDILHLLVKHVYTKNDILFFFFVNKYLKILKKFFNVNKYFYVSFLKCRFGPSTVLRAGLGLVLF